MPQPSFFTSAELQTTLRIAPTTFRLLVRRLGITPRCVGRAWLFTELDAMRLCANSRRVAYPALPQTEVGDEGATDA